MTSSSFVVRAARVDDGPAICRLRDLAGPGFTSLAVADETLCARVAKSAATFASPIEAPGPDQRYMLVLEHLETGEVVGLAAAKACIGERPPFYNFRVLRISQASAAAHRRFDMEVLILVNEFGGCSEVGSLFVRADRREAGVGRMLAQARYMLMAVEPARFADTVVSELRGVVGPDGVSPFWEHLGRHFFKMTFREADVLSATTDNQFILDLMPKYPIYVDLLPEEARAVIGKTHAEGQGALRLLEWEGFQRERVVDIFDGGPLVSAPRNRIRTFRGAKPFRTRIVDAVAGQASLVAAADVARFRCVAGRVETSDGEARVEAATARALEVTTGDTVLVWSDHADRTFH